MRPHRLAITAFGPYAESQVIDFDSLGEHNLFLITGDIGAGKTTIFDAICCALYGETSGGERTVEEMRSHHALPETATEIALDFSIQGEFYRAWFSPKQLIPKKRGEGFTEQGVQSALYKIDFIGQASEAALLVGESISKTRPEIEGLIGFNVNQFRQVVMLAQGKFRELLNANSADREAILKTLVDTEFLSRFERKLKTLETELKQQTGVLEAQIKGLLQSENVENAEALLSQQHGIEQQWLDADQQLNAAETVRARTETELNQAQALTQLFSKQQGLMLEQRILAEQKELMSGIDAALKNHSNAEKLWPDYRLYEEAQNALTAADANLKKALEDQSAYAKSAETTAENWKQIEAENPTQEQRKLEYHTLQQINKALVLLAADKKNHHLALRRLEQAQQHCLQVENDLRSKNQQLEQTTDKLSALAPCDAALISTQNQLEKKQAQLQRLKRIEEQHTLQQGGAEEVKQSNQRLLEQEHLVGSLRAALQQLEQARLQDLASHWASQLQDGQACVVCGSLHHPAPAARPKQVPPDAQFEHAAAELQKQEKIRLKFQEQQALAEKKLAGIESLLKELTGSLENDSTTISQCHEAIEALTQQKQQIELQLQQKHALQQQQSELKAVIKAGETALANGRQQQNDYQAQVSTLAGQINTQLKIIPESYQDKTDLNADIAALAFTLQRFDERLIELRSAHQSAQQKLNTALGALSGAQTQQHSAANDFQRKENTLQQALANSHFADLAELKSARLPEHEVAQKKEQLAHHQQETLRIQTQLNDLTPHLAGRTEPDLEPLAAAYLQAQNRKNTLLEQKGQLEQRRAALAKLIQRIALEKERLSQVMQDYQQASHLSQIANGGGYQGSKLSFSRYLLGRLLDEILAAASTRLNIMSEGRYQLIRKRDQANKKSAFGLDIELTDAYTGQKRSVNTFSGGEGFLASLSLALGLSEVVQNNAGGIQLDTLFIDEGFGSLNDEALEQAINVLTTLSGDGRLVGVISHVNELKERIDAQLVVRKTANGSSAEFVL